MSTQSYQSPPTGWHPGHVSPKKPDWFISLKTWQKTALITIAAVVLLCVVGAIGSVFASNPQAQAPAGNPVAPTATGHATLAAVPTKPLVVKGSGNAVAQTGGTLTGGYRVDYKFGSWCGIVDFLKSDGADGANFMEGINDCSGDVNKVLAGSTIVHLDGVTMVKVDNTTGSWSLTFTPLK